MDRNSSNRREFLSDSEIVKRSAPGGRMPVAGPKKTDNRGGSDWSGISDGSPNAVAGQAERDFRRERPDLASKRK
jgi:hypothetical protein